MEHHLQQQVAEFVAQVVEVAAVDRVGDFVGFLDGVRRDGGEALLQVPGAAALWIAQPRHDRQQAFDVAGCAHASQSRHGKSGSPRAMNGPLRMVSRWL